MMLNFHLFKRNTGPVLSHLILVSITNFRILVMKIRGESLGKVEDGSSKLEKQLVKIVTKLNFEAEAGDLARKQSQIR
jgi:hypothetical protein